MPGTGTTSSAYLNHGNGVTSAVLFGPLDEQAGAFPQPYANVQHYRCISPALQAQHGVPDVDLYAVLNHIDTVLSTQHLTSPISAIEPTCPMVHTRFIPGPRRATSLRRTEKPLPTIPGAIKEK